MVEKGSQGAGSTDMQALRGEGDSVFPMSRQDVIDALSGNRRIVRKGFPTVIERIEPTSSGEGADLFTPPEGIQEPQG